MTSSSRKKSVLFICLGNICRSPIAEALLQHKVNEKLISDQWHIDSAGLGDWHRGLGPDKRAVQCLKQHGISTNHKARMITKKDFQEFDIIFGMDDDNMEELNDLKPKSCKAELKRLGDYDPQNERTIHDPYYGEYKDFEAVFAQCERCCTSFLEQNGVK